MRTFLSSIGVAAFFTLRTAWAEPIHTIDAPRILLMDVVALELGQGGEIELGPSPPPGGSRLVERREVVAKLRESGVDAQKIVMPAAVRVVRSARRLMPAELVQETEPALRSVLPPGVTLVSLSFARPVVVPPRATVRKAVLPKLPHRAGTLKTTVMFELADGAEIFARVPGTVTVDISDKAAEPDVLRGARLEVVIEKGPARVSAVGYALADADVGDVISFKVDGTQKVLDARVLSSQSAKVVRP